jgi:hypothetical protein
MDLSTSDWITLAGAIATTVAAALAAVALWKIADERRRTFRLGLLVELLAALGDEPTSLSHNARVKLLLRILPAHVAPSLRVFLGQGPTPAMDAEYRARFRGVDRFALASAVLDRATVEIALAVDEVL